MSHEIIELVQSHLSGYQSENSQQAAKNTILRSHSCEHLGTAESCAKRRSAALMANDGHLLAHTDRCLIHLARAIIANPDVLILHKPLAQLDELHRHLVMTMMREFVDLRGIEKPAEERRLRRPRTCVFSVSDLKGCDLADTVLHVAQGNVAEVDVREIETLRTYARKLFEAIDLNQDNLVNRKEFVSAVRDAPWAAELLGVSSSVVDGDEDLSKMFDLLDRSGNGEVDFDELTDYLRLRFDAELPRVLAFLHGKSGTPAKSNSGFGKLGFHSPGPSPRKAPLGIADINLADVKAQDHGGYWHVPDVAIEMPTPIARQGSGSAEMHTYRQSLPEMSMLARQTSPQLPN
jgi:Ca2+-binding EF-hand superfamily protein